MNGVKHEFYWFLDKEAKAKLIRKTYKKGKTILYAEEENNIEKSNKNVISTIFTGEVTSWVFDMWVNSGTLCGY